MENEFKLKSKKQTGLFRLFLNSMKRLCIKRDKPSVIMKDIKLYILSMNKNEEKKNTDEKMYIKIHTIENYKNKIKEYETKG